MIVSGSALGSAAAPLENGSLYHSQLNTGHLLSGTRFPAGVAPASTHGISCLSLCQGRRTFFGACDATDPKLGPAQRFPTSLAACATLDGRDALCASLESFVPAGTAASLHPPFQKALASILQGKPALAEPAKSRVNGQIDSDPFSIAHGMRRHLPAQNGGPQKLPGILHKPTESLEVPPSRSSGSSI